MYLTHFLFSIPLLCTSSKVGLCKVFLLPALHVNQVKYHSIKIFHIGPTIVGDQLAIIPPTMTLK